MARDLAIMAWSANGRRAICATWWYLFERDQRLWQPRSHTESWMIFIV